MGGALVAISAPVYFVGLVALFIFAKGIGPRQLVRRRGQLRADLAEPGAWFDSLILPWFTLAASFAAFYARMTRGNLIETMGEDYIRTARAKGLRESKVIAKHGLRAALTPIVTMAGMDIGLLLGGAILTETVFNIPGVGRYAYDAIMNSDLPAIQGTVLFGAFFIVFANLLVDILYAFLDPRVSVRVGGALMALLEIEDLHVSFRTIDGVVRAVEGVSLSLDSRKTLGIVGESGSGKSVTAQTIIGLTRFPNATITGRIRFDGRDLVAMPTDDLRSIRGARIAMIFQDPLSSLHPFYRVGHQIVEAIRDARGRLA